MEQFKKIIKEYEAIPFEGLERGFDPELYKLDSALTIIGPRRSGKTTYLREIIQHLALPHFLFLNFEDERMQHLPDLDPFLEAYYELYNEKPHIFLDEIQNTENWHFKVRRLIDQKYKVFVTGSNANLLSRDIATHLAGRTFVKTIFPFSFREMLNWRRIDFDQDAIYGKERFAIKACFREYLTYGGFPEVVKSKLKKDLLKQYFDIAFYKDLAARYQIRQEPLLRLLIKKLHENIGSPYKVSNLRKRILQLTKAGKQTIFDYLNYLESAYVMVHLQNARRSFASRETERKTYFIDTGFLTLFSIEEEPGKLLENAVLLELLKQGKVVSYFRDKYECDFVVKTDQQVTTVIQSAWLLTDQNQEREFNGLLEAMRHFSLEKGIILTEAQEKEVNIRGKTIHIHPAWKWFLNKEIV